LSIGALTLGDEFLIADAVGALQYGDMRDPVPPRQSQNKLKAAADVESLELFEMSLVQGP
jgi:hypothetical protein